MSDEISNTDDVIDSRDVIKRIEDLESEREALSDDVESITEELSDAKEAHGDAEEGESIIEEIEGRLVAAQVELESWDSDSKAELDALKSLAEQAEGYAPDWHHGETLIRESYFEDYARELAEDLHGKEIREAHWPFSCIDWERAADELRVDYTTVDFDGVDYLVR